MKVMKKIYMKLQKMQRYWNLMETGTIFEQKCFYEEIVWYDMILYDVTKYQDTEIWRKKEPFWGKSSFLREKRMTWSHKKCQDIEIWRKLEWFNSSNLFLKAVAGNIGWGKAAGVKLDGISGAWCLLLRNISLLLPGIHFFVGRLGLRAFFIQFRHFLDISYFFYDFQFKVTGHFVVLQ